MFSALVCLAVGLWPPAPKALPLPRISGPAGAESRGDREAKLAVAEKANRRGMSCLEQRDYAHAEQFLSQALTLYQEVLGEAHPACAWHLNMLGCLCIWTDRPERAERLLLRAREIYGRSGGVDHPRYVERYGQWLPGVASRGTNRSRSSTAPWLPSCAATTPLTGSPATAGC